jgi:hypothetical protein
MLHFDRAVQIIHSNNFENIAIRLAIPAPNFRDFYPMFLCLFRTPKGMSLQTFSAHEMRMELHILYTPLVDEAVITEHYLLHLLPLNQSVVVNFQSRRVVQACSQLI